jgi:hypothetical protein
MYHDRYSNNQFQQLLCYFLAECWATTQSQVSWKEVDHNRPELWEPTVDIIALPWMRKRGRRNSSGEFAQDISSWAQVFYAIQDQGKKREYAHMFLECHSFIPPKT